MTKDKALKLALNEIGRLVETGKYTGATIQTMQAIKEALAQPEPWEKFCDSNCVWTDHHPDCKLAQRKPLTEEEIENIANSNLCIYSFARAIEAAHGIGE